VDIHVHFPEGAIPKDGPSAGITMGTSLVSALLRVPVRRDVAMTGEITLRGRVLPIGGLKDKILAAHRSEIYTVIIPKENEKDLKDIPKRVMKVMTVLPVEHMDEVLKHALRLADGEKFLAEPSRQVDWRDEVKQVAHPVVPPGAQAANPEPPPAETGAAGGTPPKPVSPPPEPAPAGAISPNRE
jgi:ATP-dependent Lon protease